MAEQELQIYNSGKKDKNGNDYLNLELKTKPKKGVKGLDNGNYVIVKKTFVEGKRFEPKQEGWKPTYLCRAKYKDQEVSFWLSEAEHNVYKTIGGIDDDVRITLVKETRVNKRTGIEELVPRLTFEKA